MDLSDTERLLLEEERLSFSMTQLSISL